MAEAITTQPPEPPESLVAGSREENIQLHHGQELTPETASTLTQAAFARVVVLAGQSESGKTSLLAAIYEKFCQGPFAGLRFAGSRTLWAFESRCHGLRVASGRSQAGMERTKLTDEQHMLHLKVQSLDDGSLMDLLFTDISGEKFRAATQTTEDSTSLTIVKRADHFVLCLDGSKLMEPKERHAVVTNGRSILRAFLEARMLGPWSLVTVLFTKADLFGDDRDIAAFRKSTETEFRETFKDRLGGLEFASSVALQVDQTVGLETLLRSWTMTSKMGAHHTLDSNVSENAREIDQFSWKR
jgi:hypothetical protein